MSDRKLRVAIIGCGGIANGSICPAYLKLRLWRWLLLRLSQGKGRKSRKRIWHPRCKGLYRLQRAIKR